MTTQELELIIGKHEMSRLELKEGFGAECIETACAFANASGGYIVIGVDDNHQMTPVEVIMNPDHRSHPRNKLIAQVFFDMGIIEQYGSGIDRIKRECRMNGSAIPDWKEVESGFSTVYQIREIHDADTMSSRHDAALKNDQDSIVDKITAVYVEIARNPSAPLSAVAKAVGLSERTVDEYVGLLKSANALRRKGGKKVGEWEILIKS